MPTRELPEQRRALDAAAADAASAAAEYDDARRWFAAERARGWVEPLAAEVWVFDPALTRVLMVRHRHRGWVPPGGAVEPGETPREGAARELREETGLAVRLLPRRPPPPSARTSAVCRRPSGCRTPRWSTRPRRSRRRTTSRPPGFRWTARGTAASPPTGPGCGPTPTGWPGAADRFRSGPNCVTVRS
ncbi:NUDIX domain-containing protein [Kitasatospora cheerisanensis]|uniref:NUDIX domain-containing protein n=1 Tax=Kitasatospora cheerisanensis TaxID=81942 RepID=UPI000B285730|nr:NUDIX hydrolase [Kitasatospora cheerisanensis]